MDLYLARSIDLAVFSTVLSTELGPVEKEGEMEGISNRTLPITYSLLSQM